MLFVMNDNLRDVGSTTLRYTWHDGLASFLSSTGSMLRGIKLHTRLLADRPINTAAN